MSTNEDPIDPVASDPEPESDVEPEPDSEPASNPPTLDSLYAEMETTKEAMETLRSTYRSKLFAFETVRQLYKETYANEHPDDPLPDLEAFPDAASLQTELDLLKHEVELAETQMTYLETVRDARAKRSTVEQIESEWDESVDGPLPVVEVPPEPEPELDPETGDPVPVPTEHERTIAATEAARTAIEQSLNAFQSHANLLDTTREGMRKRAARARASGAIDPVALYTDLEAHFGPSIAFPPGNVMDVTVRDDQGRTPLMCVVGCDGDAPHPERLGRTNVLLAMGSDLEAKDLEGNTALHRAVSEETGDPELVKLLVAHGADPFSENDAGKTCLEDAHEFALRELVLTSDGSLRHRIAKTLTPERAVHMRVFQDDPEGAARLFQSVLAKLG